MRIGLSVKRVNTLFLLFYAIEFGAKCNNILIDGISFIEKLSFNASNEGTRLKHCMSLSEKQTEVPVKKIGGDQSYSVMLTERSAIRRKSRLRSLRKAEPARMR